MFDTTLSEEFAIAAEVISVPCPYAYAHILPRDLASSPPPTPTSLSHDSTPPPPPPRTHTHSGHLA